MPCPTPINDEVSTEGSWNIPKLTQRCTVTKTLLVFKDGTPATERGSQDLKITGNCTVKL